MSYLIGVPSYFVNTSNLNLVVKDTIYAYKGLGPEIALTLTYNSNPCGSGMFGNHWRFQYEALVQQVGDVVYLWKGDGARLTFAAPAGKHPDPSGPVVLMSTTPSYDRLFDYGGFWLFVEREGRLKHQFDKIEGAGMALLSVIADKNDNVVQVQRNPEASICSLTDAAGRTTTFTYDNSQRCIGLLLPDGRQAGFSFDPSGNLIRIVDLLGTISDFEYDAGSCMTEMIIGRDQRTTRFVYENNPNGKFIRSVADAAGNMKQYELVSLHPRQVRVTDAEDNTTTYHSRNGRTERIVDPLGNRIEYAYENGQRVRVTDQSGNITKFEYDPHGNLIQICDPKGNMKHFSFNVDDNLATLYDPTGYPWNFTYDEAGNLIELASPLGNKRKMRHNPSGQIISITDAKGNESRYEHDRFGNLVGMTDALGHVTRMTYDEWGFRLRSYIDARGIETRFEFDQNDRLTKIMHNDDSYRSFGYDCCADVEVVDELGNRTILKRDSLLGIREEIAPSGLRKLFEFDKSHRNTVITDAMGRKWENTFDCVGRKTNSMNPMGTSVRYTYDPCATLISIQDENDHPIKYERDYAGRILGIEDARGNSVAFSYDPSGELISVRNARGQVVRYDYNQEGRVVAKYVNEAQAATYGYDAGGNLSQYMDSQGATIFLYTPLDQIASIQFPQGQKAAFSYDEIGNLNQVIYPSLTVDYKYDKRNRLERVSWGEDYVDFEYDSAGRLIGESRSNKAESAYKHTQSGEIEEVRHLDARGDNIAHLRFSRDAAGNITQASGEFPLAPLISNRDDCFSYNPANQIVSLNDASFEFDPDGNLLSIQNRAWTAIYDAENRLTQLDRNGQKTCYEYNALGFRGRIIKDASVRDLFHDGGGRVLWETNENGEIIRSYIYSQDSLVAMVDAKFGTHFYHFNHQGSCIALTNGKGKTAASNSYSPFGEINNLQGDMKDNPFTFVGAYGVMDEGEDLYFMFSRYYDACLGRYLQKDAIGTLGGLNLYAYVGNNPINAIDPRGFRYDCPPNWPPEYSEPMRTKESAKKLEQIYKIMDKINAERRKQTIDALWYVDKVASYTPILSNIVDFGKGVTNAFFYKNYPRATLDFIKAFPGPQGLFIQASEDTLEFIEKDPLNIIPDPGPPSSERCIPTVRLSAF